MDPTTTLITFMLQTTSSIQQVQLVGSWDNFTKRYPMERDVRRANGQWRGCYSFKDIICDGEGSTKSRRNGGLKMGSTYYYYYELDDGTEIHDASVPSTTACPYLPGQIINLLVVPVEIQRPRSRSASMSFMLDQDMKTMNPNHKFVTPCLPSKLPITRRLSISSPSFAKRVSRSISPPTRKPYWSPRMLFGFRPHLATPSQNGSRRGRETEAAIITGRDANFGQPASIRRWKSVYTRDLSPKSFDSHSTKESSVPSKHASSTLQDANEAARKESLDEVGNDENRANQSNLPNDEAHVPGLPVPPSNLRILPPRLLTTIDTTKPLPELPNEALSPLFPKCSWIRSNTDGPEPLRSRFSMSTVPSTITSPTDSSYGFSDSLSEDEDMTGGLSSGDDCNYGSGAVKMSFPAAVSAEYVSAQTLRKEASQSSLQGTSNVAFSGVNTVSGNHSEVQAVSGLQELLSDMGYLGGVITGN